MVGAMATELIAVTGALIGAPKKITEISFTHSTVSEALKEDVRDTFGLSSCNPPKA